MKVISTININVSAQSSAFSAVAQYDNDIRNIAIDPRSFVVSRRKIVYTLKSCVAHVSEIEGYLESEYRKMSPKLTVNEEVSI